MKNSFFFNSFSNTPTLKMAPKRNIIFGDKGVELLKTFPTVMGDIPSGGVFFCFVFLGGVEKRLGVGF